MAEATTPLKFWINGELQTPQSPVHSQLLVDYLRSLRLTGTKRVCGEGVCGACTVLLTRPNGSAAGETITINACTTKIISLHGTSITTVEGVGSTRRGLHPVQERLYKGHGSQCGFCSPGMVMSMVGVLKNCPTPDIEDVVDGLQGNLCRCTGYRPIVEAFSSLCKENSKGEMIKNDVQEDEEVKTFDLSQCAEYKQEDIDDNLLKQMETITENQATFECSKSGNLWLQPITLEEAIILTLQFPDAKLQLGGTGNFKKRKTFSKVIIDLRHIDELKSITVAEDGVIIGAGVTFTNLINKLKEIMETLTEDKTKLLKELIKITEKLASLQVRNIATIGGTIMWAHPSSDIIPLLMACGAEIEVVNAKGGHTVTITKDFFSKEGCAVITNTDIIKTIKVPFTTEDHIVFSQRHARRRTLDLAIANMAIFGKWSKSKNSFEDINIVAGGMEIALPECEGNPASFLEQTGQLFRNVNPKNVTESQIVTALTEDLNIENKQSNPGKMSAFRIALLSGFLIKFKKMINGEATHKTDCSSLPPEGHQLFQKAPSDQPDINPIQRPLPHISAAEQASGEAVYVNDIPPIAGEVVLVPVQSDRPHATIIHIDEKEALAINGVRGWISANDIPGRNLWSIAGVLDEEVFPSQTVVYSGQIIGLIASDTFEIGLEAAKLVKIEYKDLDPILTIDQAIKTNSFHGEKKHLKRYQNESSVTKSAVTIEGSLSLGGQEHFYFETHSALVVPSGEKDEMTVHFTTQEPSNVHVQLSGVLGIPQHKIIVKSRRTGGAFGGKERCFVALMAAAAAFKLRRPCRLVLQRSVDVDTTGHRHETKGSYKLSVDEDGKIVESKFVNYFNAGCSTDLSCAWAEVLLLRIDGGYTLNNFEGDAVALNTNLVSNTAFRGFGSPEGALIVEEAIEKIAFVMKKDPVEIRQVNLTKKGDLLHHGDLVVESGNLQECWEQCIKQSNYYKVREEVDAFNRNNENKHRKRGIAVVPMKFAPTIPFKMLNQAGAFVRVYVDGSVLLSHGGIEMGQGLHTKMVQVASKVLKIDMSKIHLIETSTETVPNATPTGGSSGTDLNGHAVILACEKIAERLEPYRKDDRGATWEACVAKAYADRVQLTAYGFYNTSPLGYDFASNSGTTFNYLTFGVGCSLVEVDCLTGEHVVLRTDIVMDVGQSLNPAIDIGQVEGAFVQGLGYMTMEQLIHSNQGRILTNNLSTCKIPAVGDIPKEFNVTLLRRSFAEKEAVFSSKGIGEPPLTLAVSVVSAIRMAILSYRKELGNDEWVTLDIPLTSERIRMACEDACLQEIRNKINENAKHPSWGYIL